MLLIDQRNMFYVLKDTEYNLTTNCKNLICLKNFLTFFNALFYHYLKFLILSEVRNVLYVFFFYCVHFFR